MTFKYPPHQDWDGDLRNLIFLDENVAPDDWIYDWKISVGLYKQNLKTNKLDDKSDKNKSKLKYINKKGK